jgi:ribosomal protein L9
MNAQTKEAIVPEQRDARYWESRKADLGAQIAKAQAALEVLETEAAEAALEGTPLPDVAQAEAELRALKRARALAHEHVLQCEAETRAAEQAEAREAAKKLAQERLAAAEEVDKIFRQAGQAIHTYTAISARWADATRRGGVRLRRSSEELRGSRLAGVLLHHVPLLFEGLGIERPPHGLRGSLAAYTKEHIERNEEQ